MVLDSAEQAEKFVDDAEALLELLEYDDEGEMTKKIISEYTEIKDYKSFFKFFSDFLYDCPNFKVVEGHINDDEAKNLWNSIDYKNKNTNIQKSHVKIFISKIIQFEIDLIKGFFKISN